MGNVVVEMIGGVLWVKEFKGIGYVQFVVVGCVVGYDVDYLVSFVNFVDYYVGVVFIGQCLYFFKYIKVFGVCFGKQMVLCFIGVEWYFFKFGGRVVVQFLVVDIEINGIELEFVDIVF